MENDLPYPGFPPNYTSIDRIVGLHRDVVVIEFLSLSKLSKEELADSIEILKDAITVIKKRHKENIDMVTPVTSDRFDRLLRDGLRL